MQRHCGEFCWLLHDALGTSRDCALDIDLKAIHEQNISRILSRLRFCSYFSWCARTSGGLLGPEGDAISEAAGRGDACGAGDRVVGGGAA